VLLTSSNVGALTLVQAKEAEVERKLNTEVKVLDNAISTMGANLIKVKAAVRDLHHRKDLSGARAMFVQMTNLVKQIDRFKQLHYICSSMLERVKEQAVMATTSIVMQQFVSVHEDLIKDCNLDKLVYQYQELQDNVDGIRSGFDDMANAATTVDPNEPDWDDELKNWLAEEELAVQPQQMTAPRAEIVSSWPDVTEVTRSFPTVPPSDTLKGVSILPDVPSGSRSPPPFPSANPIAHVASASALARVADSALAPTAAPAAAPNPVQAPALVTAQSVPIVSTLSASANTFPPVPVSTGPSSPVRDLKALFGDVVVKKEKMPVED